MTHLNVTLKIPFDSESPTDMSAAITFTRWLPVGREYGIATDDEGMRILLWFDDECAQGKSRLTPKELNKYMNIDARYINAEVRISGVDARLLEYIRKRGFVEYPTEEDKPFHREYNRIAGKILASVILRVNRLLAFARSYKAQYWLSEYKIDFDLLRNYFSLFEGRANIDNGPPFIFMPPQVDTLNVSIEDGARYITESDWPAFRDFITGASRPHLVGELLAGAEHLLSVGHYRSAITEAVTALEVSVFEFASHCNAEKAFGPYMARRLAVNSLKAQVKHLGLSATVNYLLPTILPEKLLPASVISECQSALTLRQNIVHNGQRDIKEGHANSAISGIRACCEALEKVTYAPA